MDYYPGWRTRVILIFFVVFVDEKCFMKMVNYSIE